MITLPALKEALRVRNDEENTYILSLEEAAVAAIERATGQYFGTPKTVTETLYASNGPVWLLSVPISITSVSLRESGIWTVLGGTLYEASGRRVALLDEWRYPIDVQIEYEAGFEDGEQPADIRQKVTQLVTLWFEQRLATAELSGAEAAVFGFNPTI